MKTDVILKNDCGKIYFFTASKSDPGDVTIMTYDEIISKFPECLRTESMVAIVQDILISGLQKFTNTELSIIGEFKVRFNVQESKKENSIVVIDSSVKNFLLSSIREYYSIRVINGLKSADIKFMYQILLFHDNDFFKFRNFGKKSFDELKLVLKQNKITPDVESLIRSEWNKVNELTYKEVPAAFENNSYRKLIELFEPFVFLNDTKISDYYGVMDKIFPYRSKNDDYLNPPRTKFEERFISKEDQEFKMIKELMGQIIAFIEEFKDIEIKKVINRMRIK